MCYREEETKIPAVVILCKPNEREREREGGGGRIQKIKNMKKGVEMPMAM